MPVSARISPINGATPVSAGRRLAARTIIPNTRRRLRRRERPDAAVAESFFVMLCLPHLGVERTGPLARASWRIAPLDQFVGHTRHPDSTSEEEPVDGKHYHRSKDRYCEAPIKSNPKYSACVPVASL